MNNPKPPQSTSTLPVGTGNAVPNSGTAIATTGTAIQGSGTAQVPNAFGQGRNGLADDIPIAPSYVLNGITYNTIQPIATKSGEAKVIIVENAGNKFCLKIYIVGHTPDASLLDLVKKAQGGFLVNLRDHGTWCDLLTGCHHYFEVMDYAEFGALDAVHFSSEEQFVETAMRMAMCIHQCHKLNIVHRDIKPENFLCTSKDRRQFVLSDFGIARMMQPGQSEASFDIAKSGYFVSPEGAMTADNRTSMVGYATDYYSMGMTLLAMVIGIHNFYSIITSNDLLRYKSNNTVVDKFLPYLKIADKPLSDYALSLLRGLLQLMPHERIGFDDIKQWYASDKPIAISSKASDISSQSDFSVTFNDSLNLVAHSPKELAKMMLDNFEYAKGFLYRGLAKSGLERTGKVALALAIDKIVEQTYPSLAERDAGVYAAALILDTDSPFIGINGTICRSINDIKNEIWTNRAFYSKNLAKHGATIWAYFAAQSDPKIRSLETKFRPAIELSHIHGIYALCKELDPSLPFFSLQGQPLTSPQDIAAEILHNRLTYQRELSDHSHPFWMFLEREGDSWAKIAHDYPSLIKQDPEGWIFELIYRLDSSKPYLIQYEDDQKWHEQYSVADIIKNVSKHGITDISLANLAKPYTQTWLTLSANQYDRKCGALLAKMVNEAGNEANKKGWFYLYNFAPKADISLVENGNLYSPEQLGEAINNQLVGKATAKIDLLAMLVEKTFNGSRIYQYMEARKMQKHIQEIESIIDISANEKLHPSAPYNQTIAHWKVVQLLGFQPFYFIGANKVSSLDEIQNLASQANAEINNGLAEYLTILFHERVDIQFSLDEFRKYYHFLLSYCPDFKGLQNTATMRSVHTQQMNRCQKAWHSFNLTYIISVWTALIPMLLSSILAICLYTYCADIGLDKLEMNDTWISIRYHNIIDILAEPLEGWPRYTIGIICGLGSAFLCLGMQDVFDAQKNCFGYIRIGWLAIPVALIAFCSLMLVFEDDLDTFFILLMYGLLPSSAIWFLMTLIAIKIPKSKQFASRSAIYSQKTQEIELLLICATFGTLKRTFGNQKITAPDDVRASKKNAKQQKKYAIWLFVGIAFLTVIATSICVKLISELSKIQSFDPYSNEITQPQNLDLQLSGNYIYYYINEQEFKKLSGAYIDLPNKSIQYIWHPHYVKGLVIDYTSCPTFVLVEPWWNASHGYSWNDRKDRFPSRKQISTIFSHWDEIVHASQNYLKTIQSFSPSSNSEDREMVYWTRDECGSDSAWAYNAKKKVFVKRHKQTELGALHVADLPSNSNTSK